MNIIRFNPEEEIIKEAKTKEEFEKRIESEKLVLQRGFNKLLCLSEIEIEPKPWQIETAIKTLRDMRGNAILADEVGLGKTIEAGLIMKELLERGLITKILILVPAPLLDQWKEEMKTKFNLEFVDFKERNWSKHNLIISSMPYASRSKTRREQLQTTKFDLLVVDEAHSLKNHRTATYKFVYGISRKNTILMSATPIQNDLKELYNLINILRPGHFKSRKLFAEEYISDRFRPKNINKLKRFISEVMIRHKRSNTLVELPRRNVYNIEIDLTPNEREFYYEVIQLCKILYEKEVFGALDEMGKTVLTLVGLLKQNCSSPQAVIKYLEKNTLPKLTDKDDEKYCKKVIENGKKIGVPKKAQILIEKIKSSKEQCIVYTEFLETVDMLKNQLEKEGIKVVPYHGSLSSKQKTQAIKDFKEGKYQVLLATESGGQGLI